MRAEGLFILQLPQFPILFGLKMSAEIRHKSFQNIFKTDLWRKLGLLVYLTVWWQLTIAQIQSKSNMKSSKIQPRTLEPFYSIALLL